MAKSWRPWLRKRELSIHVTCRECKTLGSAAVTYGHHNPSPGLYILTLLRLSKALGWPKSPWEDRVCVSDPPRSAGARYSTRPTWLNLPGQCRCRAQAGSTDPEPLFSDHHAPYFPPHYNLADLQSVMLKINNWCTSRILIKFNFHILLLHPS